MYARLRSRLSFAFFRCIWYNISESIRILSRRSPTRLPDQEVYA